MMGSEQLSLSHDGAHFGEQRGTGPNKLCDAKRLYEKSFHSFSVK
jgi:hypothetical protein